MPGEYRLVNTQTGESLAERLIVGKAAWRRLFSLLGRRWLQPGEGNRFLASLSPHAPVGGADRLPVDMLFLDREGVVLHAVHSLPPFALRRGTAGRVHSIVELPAGTLDEHVTHT